MLTFPWAFIAKPLAATLAKFPRVADWRARIKERPEVQRAIDLHKSQQTTAPESQPGFHGKSSCSRDPCSRFWL